MNLKIKFAAKVIAGVAMVAFYSFEAIEYTIKLMNA